MPIYTVEIDGKQYDIEGDRPPSEAEARAAVGSVAPETTPKAATQRMGGIDFVPDEQWDAMSVNDKVRGGLTAAATVVGSMMGIPLEQARDMADNPKRTLAEFALPGVIEKAGGLVKAGAKGLYRSVLKPGKAVKEATIGGVRRAGGDAATEELLKHGIPITRSGKGLAAAENLRGQSRQAADKMIAAYDAGGGSSIPAIEALNEMQPVMAQARNAAAIGKPNQVPGVVARARAFLDANQGGMSGVRTQTLKRTAQQSMDDAYRAAERGQVIDDVGTLFDKQLATGSRKALERRIPGLAAQNLNTQRLGTAAKAIGEAEGRIANNNMVGMGDMLSLGTSLAGATTGGATAGAEGALIGAMLGPLQAAVTRPEIASRLAIAGYRAGSGMRNPAVARALAAIMASHEVSR